MGGAKGICGQVQHRERLYCLRAMAPTKPQPRALSKESLLPDDSFALAAS